MSWGWRGGWQVATEAADARLVTAAQRFERVCEEYERQLNEQRDLVTMMTRQLDEQIRRGDLLADRLIEQTGARGVSAARDQELQRQHAETRALRDTIEFDELDEAPFGKGGAFASAEAALIDAHAREEETTQ